MLPKTNPTTYMQCHYDYISLSAYMKETIIVGFLFTVDSKLDFTRNIAYLSFYFKDGEPPLFLYLGCEYFY